MRADIVPGRSSRITSFPITPENIASFPNCRAKIPMIVILSRGAFCPKDRRQHEGLLQLHREMEVGYCRLVTISTDNITDTNEFRTGVEAHWPFLSDPRRIVQKDLDIAEYTDPEHNPMIPHTSHPRAGSHYLQDLHGLLVLRKADGGRFASGPARGA